MSQSKISIEDVARHAKVSITTVSRVLNNVPTVSSRNRAKVEEAIALLKFKPNISAQRLARGVNNSIGLVIPGFPGIFHSFYAIELIRGVGHACETLKLDMVFHITNGSSSINTNNVGGIVFADIIENRKQVESAIQSGTPCVVINHKVTDLDISYIAVDNEKGGEMATDYLVNLGHKKIATVTGNINTQAGFERLQGYKNVLAKKKIEAPKEYIFEGDYSRRCARIAIEKFLALKDHPTAIFAASDEMALEIIGAILEKGLKVPNDISVIGFDDNPACIHGPVSLTTIRQPLFKMAEDAVRLLNGFISSEITERKRILLTPELVVRESCASSKK
jgi:LacI family transcriptional regulator